VGGAVPAVWFATAGGCPGRPNPQHPYIMCKKILILVIETPKKKYLLNIVIIMTAYNKYTYI